jgi:hypothetical protein
MIPGTFSKKHNWGLGGLSGKKFSIFTKEYEDFTTF